LGIFLSRLANMPRIVNVSGLKINATAKDAKGKKKKKNSSNGTIVADFTLTAYTLIGGAQYGDAAQDE
jgi:hypothetical protein